MNDRIIGQIKRVNGPVIEVMGITDAEMFELVRVGNENLIGEIIKLETDSAVVQVYEDTTGIAPYDPVYGAGMQLSAELGPGMVGTIYDGIQRPLEEIRRMSGIYIGRGITVPSLARDKKWHFVPTVKNGDRVAGGAILGTVQETENLLHKILVPPGDNGILESIASEGDYTVEDAIGVLKTDDSQTKDLFLMHRWPIRLQRPTRKRLALDIPLITGQRVIDTLFPVAKGGTVAIPGGFGTGKTMTQQAVAKWCDADLIVYIGCGERGNEITDVLTEFPDLIDPRTGRSLMERTILIANTSNMPVSAREASIYTGITMAEYFRDQGYDFSLGRGAARAFRANGGNARRGRLPGVSADKNCRVLRASRLNGNTQRRARLSQHNRRRFATGRRFLRACHPAHQALYPLFLGSRPEPRQRQTLPGHLVARQLQRIPERYRLVVGAKCQPGLARRPHGYNGIAA